MCSIYCAVLHTCGAIHAAFSAYLRFALAVHTEYLLVRVGVHYCTRVINSYWTPSTLRLGHYNNVSHFHNAVDLLYNKSLIVSNFMFNVDVKAFAILHHCASYARY